MKTLFRLHDPERRRQKTTTQAGPATFDPSLAFVPLHDEEQTEMANTRENQIGALWKKKSRKGEVYFTGQVGDTKVVAFINRKADDENRQPSISIYKSVPKEERVGHDESEVF